MGKVRAGIDIDALTKEFDDLCAEVTPSEVVLRIYELEREHAQHVLANYNRFVQQTEAYIDLLFQATHWINYVEKSGWAPHKAVQWLLIMHNLKSLFSAFDRLMKGYYEDAQVLLRPTYEAFFRVIFISLNPDDPHHSFAPRKKGNKQFNLTNFVTQELGLKWRHYNVMSSIAHANWFSTLNDWVKLAKEGQKEPIGLNLDFNEDLFSVGINQLGLLLLFYLRIVVALFLQYGKQDADLEITEKCRKYIDLCQKGYASHVSPHLQSQAKDVNDIFQMLEEVEAGHDWKEVWNRLRSP